jgi:SAM-dependent methyltransferase
VFDQVAAEYDRSRWAYPDELVEHACRLAGLDPGDPVLEVGCGTGQLTRSLAERGLAVTALDRGEHLIALARQNLEDRGDVRFEQGRFEDAKLGEGGFRAVFSAAAWHWLDPDVSWRKAAQLLVDGGMLALIQYCALADEYSADDDDTLLATLAKVAPEIAADWPQTRDLDTIIAGVDERRENVSEVWAWIGSQDVARDHVGELFGDAQIAAAPVRVEQTAAELNALWRTLSPSHRMLQSQRDALERENIELEQRLGRPIRSSTVAVLITATRRPAS